jgi:hypothetical protein
MLVLKWLNQKMNSKQFDLNKERELFEATQNTELLFERVEYIAALNAYMPKHQFADQLIVMQAAERLSYGWAMWQARAKVQKAFNASDFI